MTLRTILFPVVIAIVALTLVKSCHAQHPVTAHGVTVSFTANPASDGVDQYDVMRSTVSGGPYNTVTCSITTFTPGSTASCLDPVPGGTVVDNKFFYIAQAHHPTKGWGPPTPEVNPKGTVPTTTPIPGGGTIAAAVQ